GGVMSKTVSVGVSEFPKDCEGKLWQCIKFADVALYRAKEEGRNRVVRFLPEMWKTAEY
ncbi:MAG TPA: GGDEF domain-containing protein, partial [Aquificaceae bacterium]|nr:GGDEF domain-containing protein [Aquificaceae bacterium]